LLLLEAGGGGMNQSSKELSVMTLIVRQLEVK